MWSTQCDEAALTPNAAGATNPNEGLLENLIHQHQSRYELMCLNYREVRNQQIYSFYALFFSKSRFI